MQLQKATRKKSKLRLNISGPSGSGKTYSALLMAKGLIGNLEKVAVIDTENGSASLYDHLGSFQTIDLQAPFTPERYIEAIDACIVGGMECIIMDSSSHEWSGAGGCLEINENLAHSKYKGNTWAAWSQTTPRHDRFVNKVLQSPIHVITCTRSKTETVMGSDNKVKKLGMKDIQRDGWEFELTISLHLDRDTHTATASKDRSELFENKDPFIITEATGKIIRDWCEKGVSVEIPIDPAAKPIASVYLTKTLPALKKLWEKNPDLHNHAAFKAAVNIRKGQLSTDDKELAHEVKELEGQG